MAPLPGGLPLLGGGPDAALVAAGLEARPATIGSKTG